MSDDDPPVPPPAGPDRFAATRWTLVCAARDDDTAARDALRDLCAAYYAPVVAFLRCEGRPDDEARELAHGFFARLLASGAIRGADPSRGRFRSYLLGALKHHLQQQRRHQRAARRGGGAPHLPLLPPTDTSANRDVAAPTDPAPDRVFDRQWALTVVERSFDALERDFERLGRKPLLLALRPWLGGDPPAESHAALAARLGMSAGAVKVAIHRLRQRFRDTVRAEIAQTVEDQADLQEELRYLLEILS